MTTEANKHEGTKQPTAEERDNLNNVLGSLSPKQRKAEFKARAIEILQREAPAGTRIYSVNAERGDRHKFFIIVPSEGTKTRIFNITCYVAAVLENKWDNRTGFMHSQTTYPSSLIGYLAGRVHNDATAYTHEAL